MDKAGCIVFLFACFAIDSLLADDPAWKGKELAVFKWNFGGTEVVAVKPVDSDGNVMEDLEHSRVDLTSHHPVLPYARQIADIVIEQGAQRVETAVLMFGLGCGSIPHSLYHHCPTCSVTSVDISEEAIYASTTFVQKEEPPRITYLQSDARSWVAAAPSSTYDVIVNDIYASENARHGGPTWSYRQKEFAAQVHRVLKPGGMYIINNYEDPFLPNGGHATARQLLRPIFGHAVFSTAYRSEANTLIIAFKADPVAGGHGSHTKERRRRLGKGRRGL